MNDKNIRKLIRKLKSTIEENNLRDLVENYENILIVIDPSTKTNEFWKFAKVKEDPAERRETWRLEIRKVP